MMTRLATKKAGWLPGLVTACFVAFSGTGRADDKPHASAAPGASGNEVGSVRFEVTSKPEVQDKFDRAVAMLHSFWYEEVDKAFSDIGEQDPRCSMAYWGVAMGLYHPLWRPPDAATLRRGWEAVEKARAIGAQTPREHDYIAAIEMFYRDWDKTDHKARALAYSKAMEQVHQRYPDDSEAAVFYALSLLGTAPPTDKTYANQERAAKILNQVSIQKPDHPGVIHYIIHAYDSPPLAHLALPAARRYAGIAPAVPHALHMPSHIFTRLGLWEESIQSNSESVAAARDYAHKTRMKGVWDEQIHSMDYLAYAYLQSAQDRKAKAVLDEMNAIAKVSGEEFKAAYAFAAVPARYALERRRWSEAAALSLGHNDFQWERFQWAAAMIHLARGLGAARSGDVAGARKELEILETTRRDLPSASPQDWATPTEVARREVAAWLTHAKGRNDEAIQLMRAAADLEDTTEKLSVTPGPVVPARELLGDLLLESKQPADALREYEIALRNAPKRFNGLFGAARAADLSGDRNKARGFYEQLVEISNRADDERPELKEARSYLENPVARAGSTE
jgi:tetratricopeptide (TPR) repeat protein